MFNISADEIEYSIGDFVICINDQKPNGSGFLVMGNKYQIMQMDYETFYLYNPTAEDKMSGGWYKNRFKKVKND